jgi:hypothetical protein
VIPGATAVGGGDLIVVVDSVVLLLVESVTIGSAAYAVVKHNKVATVSSFFMISPGHLWPLIRALLK